MLVTYVFQSARGTLKLTANRRVYHGEESDYIQGIRLEYQDHLYTTEDEEIIGLLDKHPSYGVTFQRLQSSEEFDTILKNAKETPRFSRGPATTMAERLGAPKPVPPDMAPIRETLGRPKQKGKDE
jgi:hypothetical protein